MKTILLMVHDDPGQEARLQCALDITREVEGHLICLDLLRLPIVIDAYGTGGGMATILTGEQDREELNVSALQARVSAEGVSHEWQRAQGDFEHSLARAARLVDLIVLSAKGVPGLIDQGDLPARVARATAAPILVVPQGHRGFAPTGRVLVGWDGSATAATTIRAATPLLKLTDSVEVLTISGSDYDPDPEDVARYLARQGCRVTTRTIPRAGEVGKQLRDALSSADWGVVGSYGQGRLRERLFGGTTWTLLEETPVPLLISH
ncbi:MAG TPA: universal stress protein [Sphingobium sp.]|uniref:universal stress protein n=1 Tax=Sphingobium sp. TaxID=1912891 RepID=UPI002ED4B317